MEKNTSKMCNKRVLNYFETIPAKKIIVRSLALKNILCALRRANDFFFIMCCSMGQWSTRFLGEVGKRENKLK